MSPALAGRFLTTVPPGKSLRWVFVAACGPSIVVVSGGYSIAVHGLLIAVASLVASTGSRHTASVVVAHGLSCSAACGIFPDQGLNLCSISRHWQADS